MNSKLLNSLKERPQYLVVLFIVAVTTLSLFVVKSFIGYKIVALIYLLIVSIKAMFLDFKPTLLSAFLSALFWNFLFIPPTFTFHISEPEDVLMFIMFFVVALVNIVFQNRIRKIEAKSRQKEENERTLKLYSTLLNSLSHELRTPIATIIGAIDTIKDSKDKLSSTNYDLLLNEIEIAGNRLDYQVENLLNMSRLESGMLKLKLDWCDVNEMVYLLIEKQFDGNARIIFEEVNNFPLCKMDMGLTEQVLINLIGNSLQYNYENCQVIISISTESENLIIEIKDNGVGVLPEYLPYLFEKFYRVPNTKSGGTGLGLSIVKGFVDAMNGTIFVENVTPKGLCFKITIPVEMTYLNNIKNE
ncbi:ATP-binding protein [Flavobacterium sp. H122]|uniref:sensor histidine kinase n=1 Tax=Flavobacterium sp. H122 TaxID=2529860 RepID=UPI0020BE14CD|nr:ATP-binding protein [Flavobacterium sp. H122]